MLLAAWACLLVGGTLAGTALVGVLALPKGRGLLSAAGLLVVALAASVAGVIGVALASGRADEAIVSAFLGTAACLGGFALGGAFLAQIAPYPEPAAIPCPLPEPAVPDVGVILLAEAEPERYDPGAVARELRDLAEDGVQLPPETARVFIYVSEKARYRMQDGSPARDTIRRVATQVSERLAAHGGFGNVEIAWCTGEPLLDQVVTSLASQGVRDVVIVGLMVGDEPAAQQAKRRVDTMRATAHGVRVAYASPLWTSAALAGHVADRVCKALGEVAPPDAGVALLGGGRPAERDESHPAVTEHETFFHQRVRALLVERGFDTHKVRLGWVEWQEPGVTEVVRHLAALGCSRVIVAPASMPVDTLSTTLDISEGVAQARVEDTAEVVVLPAWGTDPAVIEALTHTIVETADAELR